MPRLIRSGEPPDISSDMKTFLIYGDTGCGKTYALKTLPESMRPALMLDFDRGSRELNKDPSWGTFVQFDVTDPKGKPVMFDQTKSFLEELAQNKHKDVVDLNEIRTIVVDSITTLVKAAQDRTLQYFIDNGRGGNSRSDRNTPPTQAEYGMVAHIVEGLIRGIIGLNKNLIVIAHEASKVQDEVTGLSVAGPALQRSLAVSLPRYFDEVIFAKAEGKEPNRTYVWNTRASGMFVARSRHDLDAKIPQDFGAYA